MAALVAMFSGPFGAILTKLLEGAFIVATLAGLYFMIQHQAKQEQKAIDQAAILQQVVKDQQDFIKKTQDILAEQQQATDSLNTTISAIQENAAKINNDLSDPEIVKQDRPASNILKNVIKDLSGEK